MKNSTDKVCFYISDSLEKLPDLNKKLLATKAKPLTRSFVFREGAKQLIARMMMQVLDKEVRSESKTETSEGRSVPD